MGRELMGCGRTKTYIKKLAVVRCATNSIDEATIEASRIVWLQTISSPLLRLLLDPRAHDKDLSDLIGCRGERQRVVAPALAGLPRREPPHPPPCLARARLGAVCTRSSLSSLSDRDRGCEPLCHCHVCWAGLAVLLRQWVRKGRLVVEGLAKEPSPSPMEPPKHPVISWASPCAPCRQGTLSIPDDAQHPVISPSPMDAIAGDNLDISYKGQPQFWYPDYFLLLVCWTYTVRLLIRYSLSLWWQWHHHN
jgi:hypothetical protein